MKLNLASIFAERQSLIPGAAAPTGVQGSGPPAATRRTREIRVDPVRLRWCVWGGGVITIYYYNL